MRIESDTKLGFKDVLIRPKRSTLKSRSEVSLHRKYTFKHAQTSWEGIPIIAANMDHTGTIDMAKMLASHQLMTALHKFIDLNEWQSLSPEITPIKPFCFVSIGTSREELEQLKQVLNIIDIDFICLDFANGYTQHFLNFVRDLR